MFRTYDEWKADDGFDGCEPEDMPPAFGSVGASYMHRVKHDGHRARTGLHYGSLDPDCWSCQDEQRRAAIERAASIQRVADHHQQKHRGERGFDHDCPVCRAEAGITTGTQESFRPAAGMEG